MSDAKPIIVVAGATGRQGGSVVKFLLQDGTFQVRAITRNIESDKAKALSTKGAEVVQANFEDLESVRKAFKNAYGVYAMTDFWDQAGVREEGEKRQGKNLVDAAKAENIQHFIWSTLYRTSNPVAAHWNSKADVDDYLKASGLPRTSFYTCGYQEAFGTHFPITKAEDGSYEANWPILASDGRIWMFTVNDTGAWVLEAFKKPEEWINKDMRILTNVFTARELVKTLEEESGKKIKYHEVSFEEFDKAKDSPVLHDAWANMKNFYDGKLEPRDIAIARRIYPQAKTMKEWVKANVDILLPQ